MTNPEGPKKHHGPTLEEIPADECRELLGTAPVGRIGFLTEDGRHQILPVNHALDDGDVVFRSSAGTKVDVAERLAGTPVAFEVDDFDPLLRHGWSVLVVGVISEVLDTVRVARLERLGLHAWADEATRDRWVAIRVDEISGRRIVDPGS